MDEEELQLNDEFGFRKNKLTNAMLLKNLGMDFETALLCLSKGDGIFRRKWQDTAIIGFATNSLLVRIKYEKGDDKLNVTVDLYEPTDEDFNATDWTVKKQADIAREWPLMVLTDEKYDSIDYEPELPPDKKYISHEIVSEFKSESGKDYVVIREVTEGRILKEHYEHIMQFNKIVKEQGL